MAKIRDIPVARRGPSYRGRVMIDTVRGVIRVRKWPKKRGRPKSALQRWWNDWFKQANLLAKYADPMSLVAAKEMTKGTGLYPRDVLLKAMRGRLHWWADETGWKWFPMAATQDVSNSLDTVAQVVGSVLVRALDRWRAPTPGLLDEVLTLKGVDLIPAWAPAAGGGAAFHGALVTSLANQAILNGTWTAIIYDSEVYDTDALHDNVTNPTRITIPAGWAKVRLNGGNEWQSNNTGERIIRFMKNGATFIGTTWSRIRASATSDRFIVSPVIPVVEGDYFEVEVWHSRGSTINVMGPSGRTLFSIEKVE